MSRSPILLLIALIAGAPVCGADDRPADWPPAETERLLQAGAEETWEVDLTVGQLIAVWVDQADGNVSVRLQTEAGAVLAEANLFSLGYRVQEVLWQVTEEAGRYRLVVAAGRSVPVRYRLAHVDLRPATAEDRRRHEAEQLLREGIATAAAAKRDSQMLETALAQLERAASLFSTLGLSDREAYAGYRSAHTWYRLGRIDEAVETGREAAKVAQLHGHGLQQGLALLQVQRAHDLAGELELSLQAGEEAVAAFARAGQPMGAAMTRLNLVSPLTGLARFAQAEAELEQALPVFRQVGWTSGIVAAFINLGHIHYLQGHYYRTLECQQQAQTEAKELGPATRTALLLNFHAVLDELGEVDRALEYLRQAEVIAREHELKPQLAIVHANLGFGLLGKGELDEARGQLEQALALWREIGDRLDEADTLTKLGIVAGRTGRAEDAEQLFAQALAIQRQAGQPKGTAESLLHLGEARRRLGRFEGAEQPLRQALQISEQLGLAHDEADTWLQLALLERDRGDLARAEISVQRAAACLESMHARVLARELRTASFTRVRQVYDLWMSLLVQLHQAAPGQGHDQQAFAVSERSRARSLAEQLAMARVRPEAMLPAELEQQISASLKRIGQLQKELLEARSGDGSEGTSGLEEELRQTILSHDLLEGRARQESAGYGALEPPKNIGLDTARRLLPPATALLEYHLAEEGSVLFVVTSADFRMVPLPAESQIAALVEQHRAVISRPGRLPPRITVLASRLWECLVEPAAPWLEEVEELLIVPDGVLFSLPFETLLTSRTKSWSGAGANPSQLPFLLRRWRVCYSPSVATLLALSARQRSKPAGVLVAAFGEVTAAADRGSVEVAGQPVTRGVIAGVDLQSLSALPFSGEEVRTIAGLFPTGAVRLFTGSQASEHTVKISSAVRDASVLHFSTHAIVSDRSPGESGLLLSWPPQAVEDGILQAREIFELELDADVVVLSGCETGLGRLVHGEGFVGLSQAFFAAGARNLVVSLWRVSDRSSAELMNAFYRRLAGGGKPAPMSTARLAAALHQAKLELLADRSLAHPYHWAPFVIVGGP